MYDRGMCGMKCAVLGWQEKEKKLFKINWNPPQIAALYTTCTINTSALYS